MEFSIDFSINNAAILFDIDLEFEVGPSPSAHIDFEFETDLWVSPGTFCYGYASLPHLVSIGGDIPDGYGAGSASLPVLTSQAEGGFYVPPSLEYGFAYLPTFYSGGICSESCPGSGSASIPAFLSKGGEGEYGEGSAALPAIVSYAFEGEGGALMSLFSFGYVYDGEAIVGDSIIFISSIGTITDTFTATRKIVSEFISSLTLTDSHSVLGYFLLSIEDSISLLDPMYEKDLDGALIDQTARVWVVNVETEQSSQFDDYGFNSFLERDGEYFGLADDGIYKLEGATDAGVPIPWEVDFGTSDCGVPGRKKIPDVHIGTLDGTEMYLRVITETGTQTYKVEECLRGSTGWRARIYEDMYGTSWNFTIISEGADELTGVEFSPIKLSRRL